jgi:hypothetical protein
MRLHYGPNRIAAGMSHKLVVAVLLICYGGPALVGPELHSLLGCEHQHSNKTAAAGDSASSRPSALNSTDGHHRHGAGHDVHDCLICKLLAMPQSSPAAVTQNWVIAGAFRRVIFSSSPLLAGPLASFQIRGPPAGAPSAVILFSRAAPHNGAGLSS